MADYIDREALIGRLTRNLNACNPGTFSERCYQDAINTVTFFPASDVAPVVHGRWEVHEHPYIKPRQDGWICTNCSFVTEDIANGDTNYCPNCGAKMDGDGNG